LRAVTATDGIIAGSYPFPREFLTATARDPIMAIEALASPQ
jgi:hypothetical protein